MPGVPWSQQGKVGSSSGTRSSALPKPAYLTFKRAKFYPPSEKFLQTDVKIEMPSIPSAQNLFALDGLVAVVTGGGSGIGLMISRALASNGASSVYILGLPDDPLQEIAKQSVRT
jgi:hypothetical protein